MTKPLRRFFAPRRPHNAWLILIAGYKVLTALLFVAIAIGAGRLLHKDIADELTDLARELHFNPDSKLIGFLLEKASQLSDHNLRQISISAICYAVLEVVEGVGLYLEKIWAEYLTLLISVSFLPIEIYEIAQRPTWFRGALFLLNLSIVGYLIYLIRARGAKTAR